MFKLNKLVAAAFLFTSLGVASAPAFAEDLKVVKQVAPTYPKRAERRGITGKVTVAFDVSVDGKVQSPKVVKATPEGVFDEAAIEALSRWKFAPLSEAQSTELTIEFNVS